MKKNLLLAISILGICPELLSQSLYPVSVDKKISYSELIVEGKVIAQKSFWNPQHTMIYTSNTVEVYKVFKGNVNTTTIEIMTTGGSVDNKNITVSDLLELSANDIGVFFCYPNQINLRSPQSNRLLYDIWSSSQGFYRYNPVTLTANAPFVRIGNIENNLYRELQDKTGRSYQEIKPFKVSGRANHGNRVQATPDITSFSPTTVNAGATLDPATNELTINGTNFGTASGFAAVLFDDANDGANGDFIGLAYNNNLIISWSATQIKVRVPSRAGTGFIAVINDAGEIGGSATELTVNYAILTASFTDGMNFVTKESNLMNTNAAGGYTVVYSTSTAGGGVNLNTDPAKATFQRALTTWKELTGVNFVEAGTTSNQVITQFPVADDLINTIMFDNDNTTLAPLAAGVLAICVSYSTLCGAMTNQIQKTGFDIVIRNAGFSDGSTDFTIGPCPPASSDFGEIDLETVLLHELGHALNLAHIIDDLQGSSLPEINPGKLMNFSVVNGVKRSTPDNSAYTGALYAIAPQGNTYGGPCAPGMFTTEMTLGGTTLESKDDCPSFPGVALTPGTVVAFDLVHATSRKSVDPQYDALNCNATGTGVTNTAFYALKTSPGGSGTLLLTVSGYSTTPAALASCTDATTRGIELALYAVSSCPAGQAFPAPIACRTFNGNGALTAITGLSQNTTYLLVADGIENTKANFSLTFGGNALPITLLSFTGEKKAQTALLKWQTGSEFNNDRFEIETSKAGTGFYKIGSLNSAGNSSTTQSYNFTDKLPAKGINHYRLRQVDKDGKETYSKTVSLSFEDTGGPFSIYPNPVTDRLTVYIARPSENVMASIFSPDGKLVIKESLGAVQRSRDIDVSKLSAGTYILKISAGDETYQVKFLK